MTLHTQGRTARRIVLGIAAALAVASAPVSMARTSCRPDGQDDNITRNAILSEMLVKQQTCQLDSRPHRVLCIGNSITLHLPSDAVNWYSSQGMAASKPEQDYCHVLERLMRQHNRKTTVTPVNIANWERDPSLSLDSLLRDKCEGKDIIVIRIGENVQPAGVADFEKNLSALIDYCTRFTRKIVLTGEYWPHAKKELAIVRNAHKYGLKYVPIDWIWNLYREECSPKEGDTLYDVDGKPYAIKGQFILTHPNDTGMELIAKSIYSAL